MNLFDVLLHPDREELEHKERSAVVEAANALQVGEFQCLQLAYREWYGHDLPEALVDRLFTSYMLKNQVPHWARHYARTILTEAERGTLDDRAAAYHRFDADFRAQAPDGLRLFLRTVGILLFVLTTTLVAAHLSVGTPTSILPPYFDADELPPTPSEASGGPL